MTAHAPEHRGQSQPSTVWKSVDAGETWSEKFNVSSSYGIGAVMPRMTVNSQNRLQVGWYESATHTVTFRERDEDGDWQQPVEVSYISAMNPPVAITADRFDNIMFAFSNRYTGRPNWSTIQHFYPLLLPGLNNPGPNLLPLDVTRAGRRQGATGAGPAKTGARLSVAGHHQVAVDGHRGGTSGACGRKRSARHAPLMSLINVDTVDMTIFVPQAELPRVQIGMPAKVYADAYPDEVFNGEVASIAQQAQLSSRDTQNQEDRTNVVFAVKVRLPNSDKRLKAGMTADAELVWQ